VRFDLLYDNVTHLLMAISCSQVYVYLFISFKIINKFYANGRVSYRGLPAISPLNDPMFPLLPLNFIRHYFITRGVEGEGGGGMTCNGVSSLVKFFHTSRTNDTQQFLFAHSYYFSSY